MKSVGMHLGNDWQSLAPPLWLRHWRPRTVALDDGTLDVIDAGEGPPLVLAPPLPGYKEAFVACLPLLAERFRVVTFDMRARLRRAEPWAQLADDMTRVVNACGLERFTLVGHSLGGALAQQWALAHAERVRALALSSAFRHVSSPRGHWYMRYVEQPVVVAGQRFMPRRLAMATARHLARRRGWVYDPSCDDAVLEIVRLGIKRCPIGLGLDRVRLAYSHDTRRQIGELSCPTLLIVGENDTEFAREETFAIGRDLHLDVSESPGAGHLHPLSNAQWFAGTVGRWMGSLPDA